MAQAHEILGSYNHFSFHTNEVIFLISIITLSLIIYKIRKD
jgi:hypothetical protein